jgi:phytanoyl-CoA hydroxylase
MSIPFADAAKQDSLTEAQAKYFHEKGFLVVKNMVSAEELEILRKETFDIIQQRNVGPDFWYNDEIPSDWYNNYKQSGHNNQNEKSEPQDNNTERKRGVPFRVEYVVDKMESCKRLIAHPFLLKSIAQLQGPDFLPTWDSLVFKYEGDGVPIKWHRDASAESIG